MVKWRLIVREMIQLGQPTKVGELFAHMRSSPELCREMRWSEKRDDWNNNRKSFYSMVRDLCVHRKILSRTKDVKDKQYVYRIAVAAPEAGVVHKPKEEPPRKFATMVRRKPNVVPWTVSFRQRFAAAVAGAPDLPCGQYSIDGRILIAVSADGVRTWRGDHA